MVSLAAILKICKLTPFPGSDLRRLFLELTMTFLSHAHRSHLWTHPHAQYVIMRRSRHGSAFWRTERLNLKFDPFTYKKRKKGL